MVPLTMKKKAERRMREILADSNVAQPDEVEYGPRSVTMFWHSVRKSVSVDVSEKGEIGESRMGPPSPKWGSGENDRVARLATLREKRAAEQSARALLDDHGLPQPDEVEYGATCVRLIWNEEKLVLIVDIDDPAPGPADAVEPLADVIGLGADAVEPLADVIGLGADAVGPLADVIGLGADPTDGSDETRAGPSAA